MADIFIVPGLPAPITDQSYDPLTGPLAGGGFDAYATATQAYNAGIANIDVLWLREGVVDTLLSTLQLNKGLDIFAYDEGESIIDASGLTGSDAIVVSGTAAVIGTLENPIVLANGGAGSDDGVFINGSGYEVHAHVRDYGGRPIRYTGGINNLTGSLAVERCALSINDNSNDPVAASWTQVLSIDNAVGVGSTSFDKTGAGGTFIGTCLVVGGGTNSSNREAVRCNDGALLINEAYSVGLGRQGTQNPVAYSQTGSGFMSILGGVICGNINDPLQFTYSGAITFDPSVRFNEYFEIPNPLAPSIKKASFMAWDSNHSESNGNTTSLNDWVAAFGPTGKNFIYCPDDASQLSGEKITNIEAFIAAGNELGAEGESSSAFDLATDASNQPFLVYRSAGSDAITFDINTDSANTLIINVNGSPTQTINLQDNPTPATLLGNSGTTGTVYLYDQLDGLVVGGNTLTCIESTLEPAYANQWDDTESLALQSVTGLAIGTSVGTATPLTIDRTKWFNFDIAQNRATLQGLFPSAALKTFTNYKLLSVPADATSAITGAGFENIFAGITDRSVAQPNGVREFAPTTNPLILAAEREPTDVRGDSVQAGISFQGNPNVNYSKGGANNEWNIRAWVASICSYCYAYGLYPVVELGRKTNTFAAGTPNQYIYSDEDIAWMVDEFEVNGFTVSTASALSTGGSALNDILIDTWENILGTPNSGRAYNDLQRDAANTFPS